MQVDRGHSALSCYSSTNQSKNVLSSWFFKKYVHPKLNPTFVIIDYRNALLFLQDSLENSNSSQRSWVFPKNLSKTLQWLHTGEVHSWIQTHTVEIVLFPKRKDTSCCVKSQTFCFLRPFKRYTSGYRPASFDKILSHIPHISEGVFVRYDLETEVNNCSF